MTTSHSADATDQPTGGQRFFVSYSGVRLPFRLVTELTPAEIHNRNTFFRADYDAAGRLLGFEKVVYGEVAMSHRYRYYPCGALQQADITNHADEETTVLEFPQPVAG